MIKVDIKIKNGKEIAKALRNIPKDISTGILRDACRSGAMVILRGVKDATPVRTGRLKAGTSIELLQGVRGQRRAWRKADSIGQLSSITVGYAIGSKAFYIHLVNFGTETFPGYHYLEAAFERTAPRAVQVTQQRVFKILERGWQKRMPRKVG